MDIELGDLSARGSIRKSLSEKHPEPVDSGDILDSTSSKHVRPPKMGKQLSLRAQQFRSRQHGPSALRLQTGGPSKIVPIVEVDEVEMKSRPSSKVLTTREGLCFICFLPYNTVYVRC